MQVCYRCAIVRINLHSCMSVPSVGYKGNVLSVEIREDHHRCAVLNYQRWRSSWSLRRGEEWPDNVHFHHGDLISAGPLLAGRGFNSVRSHTRVMCFFIIIYYYIRINCLSVYEIRFVC